MTKFIEQRVDELENQVANLELIIHELRGKKSIEPSTTNTVEDIIEFEGKQYRKVDREACEDDYVSVSFKNGKCFKPHKIYGPCFYDNGLMVNADSSTNKKYEEVLVYNNLYGRTPETVDVYELIKEGMNPQIPIVDETIEPLTPNQQRAAVIEKAKKFVEENKSKYRSEWNIVGHTVQILIYDSNGMLMMFRQAKCNPSDVFNEHIGKAIALGRALGLDVSEFEQAVQPNEVVVGMLTRYHNNESGKYQFDHIATAEELKSMTSDLTEPTKYGNICVIINDTDAIYGGFE